jgi:excisionase family DNA binding protein
MTERLWTVDETAAYLGVSTKFCRRHAVELGAMKVGSHLRFRPSSVERYLESRSLSPRRGRGGGRLRPVS